MSNALPDVLSEQMLQIIWAEYVEMPGLRLSRKRAQRLWGLDEAACGQITNEIRGQSRQRIDVRDKIEPRQSLH